MDKKIIRSIKYDKNTKDNNKQRCCVSVLEERIRVLEKMEAKK